MKQLFLIPSSDSSLYTSLPSANMGNQSACQGGVCRNSPQFNCHCSSLPFCHDCLSLHLRSFRSDAHSPVSLRPSDSTAVTGMSYADLVLLELIYRTPEGTTEIYEAMAAGSNKHYVAKVQYCRDAAELNTRQEEAALQRSIRHPNISRCLASFLDPGHTTGFKHVLVLEHGGKGSLHELIRRRNRDQSPWHEDQLCESIANLLDAFAYLQSLNIVHRDIKPQNIIVMENEGLKVIDFGLALEGRAMLRTQDYPVLGTVLYLAPTVKKAYMEMWDGRNPTGSVVQNPFKSDVFSLGLTLYHMASLRPPTDLNNLDQGEEPLQRKINESIAALPYGEWAKVALRKMLIVKESERPDFEQLKNLIYSDGMYSYVMEDEVDAASVLEPEGEISPWDSVLKTPQNEENTVILSPDKHLKHLLKTNRASLSLSVQAIIQKTLSPEPPDLLILTFPLKPLELEAICLCIQHIRKLDKVEFINSRLETDHLVALANQKFSEIAVDEFSLGQNALEPVAVMRLVEFLPKCAGLRVLRMWDNHLGAEGMRALASGLKRLPGLKELFLGSNALGDQGAQALAQCFQHLPQLEVLSVVSNGITDVGVDYLAEQLRYAESLAKLFMDSNEVTEQGGQYLCAVLPGMKKLSVLRLLNTRLTSSFLPQFRLASPRLRVSIQ